MGSITILLKRVIFSLFNDAFSDYDCIAQNVRMVMNNEAQRMCQSLFNLLKPSGFFTYHNV